MSSYAEYFERRASEQPKPKYQYGDRVFGRWNKIPFIGSVIREQDKNLLVQLDLPIKHNKDIHNILHIARMDVKLLKDYDENIQNVVPGKVVRTPRRTK